MKTLKFKEQVELLLEVLPFVAKETCFALKGGTAINLFVRDFPRLSVDIDLTYLGDEPRDEALLLVEQALYRIKSDLESKIKGIKIFPSRKEGLPNDIKLFISKNEVQIKIEASPIQRGVLLPTESRSLTKKAVDEFNLEIDFKIVNLGDLYGGKIVAALDRQHPRDLFDVKLLFENEGITEAVRLGFITYLLGHGRPPNEVLSPTLLDQTALHESEFQGMSEVPFSYKDFELTRKQLIAKIKKEITEDEKNFLISFMKGSPEWALFKHPEIKELPAVKWKLLNIGKMDQKKKTEMVDKLIEYFNP